MTETIGALQGFACPVCGRIRPLSKTAARAVVSGERTGECKTGFGCRAALDRQERYRRFWLKFAGVDELEIRRAGGALDYVATNGLPVDLIDLAGVMPADAKLVDRRGGAGRPTRGPTLVDRAA